MPDQNPNQQNNSVAQIPSNSNMDSSSDVQPIQMPAPPVNVFQIPEQRTQINQGIKIALQSEPAVPSSPTGFQQVQPEQANIPPVQSVPPQNMSGSPLKKILLMAGGLLLVGIIGFFVWKTFFYKPAPQVVNLTYWGFRDKTAGLQSLISQYESQNPLVKINYINQSKQDYRERLANSIAQSKAPDIFEFHNTWLPMFSGEFASLPPEVMDKNTYANSFYITAIDDLAINGNIYGMPAEFDGLALFVNQSIFDGANKTPPTTWDELRKTAHDLTILDQDKKIQQSGIAMGRTDNVDHWQDILSLLMIQVGVDPARPTGKLAEDTLSYFTIFATQDNDWDESMPPSTKAFADGKTAMYLGPAYEIANIKKLNPGLSFKVVKAPQLAKDDPKIPSINWASYWANGVWSKSKNSTEAWKFVNYLTQKTSLEKLNQEDVASGGIGNLYPRPEMAGQFSSDPYVGSFYAMAQTARSWYMASNTNDGATGINSRISAYYADAINAFLTERREPKEVLGIVATGVAQVLSSYQSKTK